MLLPPTSCSAGQAAQWLLWRVQAQHRRPSRDVAAAVAAVAVAEAAPGAAVAGVTAAGARNRCCQMKRHQQAAASVGVAAAGAGLRLPVRWVQRRHSCLDCRCSTPVVLLQAAAATDDADEEPDAETTVGGVPCCVLLLRDHLINPMPSAGGIDWTSSSSSSSSPNAGGRCRSFICPTSKVQPVLVYAAAATTQSTTTAIMCDALACV